MTFEYKGQICDVGIAIVEDEKDLVDIYRRMFKKRGLRICFTAFNGREALEMFRSCTPRPDIVLMDHRLPIMSGIETTEEILKINPETKIIFLSADAAVREEALAAGAVAFIRKPASMNMIVNKIEEVRNGIYGIRH